MASSNRTSSVSIGSPPPNTTSLPPTGSPNYFLDFSGSSVNVWQFHADFTTPANSTFKGPVSVAGAAAFNEACNGGTCILQAGTRQQLYSLGDRLMYRAAYRNFGGQVSLMRIKQAVLVQRLYQHSGSSV